MASASNKSQVRLGADPELFVKVNATGKIIPVCGLIGGTKEEPLSFDGGNSKNTYAYQEDGCAFEFNVPPANSYDHMDAYMKAAAKLSKELLFNKGFTAQVVPYQTFEESQLTDPRSRTIGCSPDFDAYARNDSGSVREAFDIRSFGNMRFAGGHLHLGYDKNKVPPWVMARFLDVLIGLPGVQHDKQGVRRQYYGKAGLYREKPYGIEYRTPSNFWLKPYFSGARTHYPYHMFATMWDLAHTAQESPENLADAFKIIPWQSVQDAINQENPQLAKEVWDYAYKMAKLPARFSHMLWKQEYGI